MNETKYLLICLVIVSCSSKNGFRLKNEYNLQKSVKSIEEVRYYAAKDDDGITKGQLSGYSLMSFDAWGNILLRREFDSDKKLIKKFQNEYDYQNSTYKEFEFKNNDSLNIYSVSDYSIDSNKRISSEVHYLANGNVLFESELTYDSNGNKTKEIESENGNQTIIEWINIYEEKQLVERKEYLNGNDKFSKTIFKYDDLGNVVKKIWINQQGETVFNDSFEYDKFRNVTAKLSEKSRQTFTYEYDQNNNWIKRIEYINDTPWIITERKLEY